MVVFSLPETPLDSLPTVATHAQIYALSHLIGRIFVTTLEHLGGHLLPAFLFVGSHGVLEALTVPNVTLSRFCRYRYIDIARYISFFNELCDFIYLPRRLAVSCHCCNTCPNICIVPSFRTAILKLKTAVWDGIKMSQLVAKIGGDGKPLDGSGPNVLAPHQVFH